MPSLFHDDFDLFDGFDRDPWFDDRDFQKMEKKLYGHRAKNVMNTDIRENDAEYEMKIDLPGFKKEEISAELNDGYLTITAEKGLNQDSAEKEAKKGKYIRRERYSGKCQRSFYVGEALKQEDIKANFKHGILTLMIPKKEAKKIESDNYIAIEG